MMLPFLSYLCAAWASLASLAADFFINFIANKEGLAAGRKKYARGFYFGVS
jgi:hypothetical protein